LASSKTSSARIEAKKLEYIMSRAASRCNIINSRFCFVRVVHIDVLALRDRKEEPSKSLLPKSTALAFGESFFNLNHIAGNHRDNTGTIVLEIPNDVAPNNLGTLLELSNVSADAYMHSIQVLTELTIAFFFC
jgi:hypothetical protein